MLGWHVALFAAALILPPLEPSGFEDLGPTLVNLLALAATVAVIFWLGWQRAPWLVMIRPARPLLLVPVVVVSLSYLAAGIEGSASTLLSSALLMVSVGASEELYARGVMQEFLSSWRVGARVALVGMLFGLGHLLSGIFFEREAGEVAFQVAGSSLFGAVMAALRLHVVSIWPLAGLHALDNWTLVNSPGAAPEWWQVLVTIGSIAYVVLLVRMSDEGRAERSARTDGFSDRAVAPREE